ncbi:hypothetical protein BDW74DRAFT_146772 [Aspergillus multicolor]|uniref:uncharacterized protein n=1 Tax=Aspergillus multicolor TaxID=41759 RepID=UPI003CCDFD56
MKASIAAIALSVAGAIAAPAIQPTKRQDAGHPYTISFISLRHLTESNTFNFQFTATNYFDNGDPHFSTTCSTAWNPDVPAGPENPQACADNAFSFYFPSGIQTLENYELTVTGPDGTVTGEIVSGPKYQCGAYDGDIAGIDYECKSTNGGWFVFPLV